MTSIEKHISDLLCLHDCVIVPGLGGFVANYKSAVIIEERNLFQPPKKEIGFNRSLAHNDGLLANHICTREKTSWDQSLGLIEEFVSSTKDRINQGESIALQRIGTLRKDALGNIQFSPKERNDLRPDSFGLDEYHFEPLHHAIQLEKQEEPVRRLLRSRSPKYWGSVAAMIAGLLFFSPDLKMPEHQQIDTSSMISALSEKENITSGTVANDRSESKENPAFINTGSEIPENKASNIATSSPIIKPYHLIAGSFKHKAPAQQTLDQYKNEGFGEAHLLKSSNSRFRVALFSFENRDEAVNKLYAVRKDDALKNVWLLAEEQ
ncbi:HU domain-containing protein [Marinilabilia rubra]|uniref:SPOR domain-containing protein n=1 Tax=Marinilabilia rubra TaxID=2162893 RepID=A0A2U2BB23_9BACT|nr:HU-CCDC81 and SPOR domain-containing protein [Marinilabilia rubra]PWE00272.1 SPOR domain-containing protein [Marinilabilia rubra]